MRANAKKADEHHQACDELRRNAGIVDERKPAAGGTIGTERRAQSSV